MERKNEIELHNIPMRFMSKERNLIRVEFLSFLTLSLYKLGMGSWGSGFGSITLFLPVILKIVVDSRQQGP